MDFNIFRTAVDGYEKSTQSQVASPVDILANTENVALWYEEQSATLELSDIFQNISALLAELKELRPELNVNHLRALMDLDDLHHAYYDEQHKQFSRSTLLPQFRVQVLHRGLVGYGQGYLESYLPFLTLQNTHATYPEIQALLPTVMARMMRYLSELATFQFYRHMFFDAKGWWLAHQLYGYAEQRDWLDLPAQLFEDKTVTSIAGEYKILLLMSLIHCDHLTPTQLHTTLGLVRWELAKHLTLNISAVSSSSAGFFVNLKQNAAPYFWSTATSTAPLPETDDLYEINTQGAVLLLRAWLMSLKSQEVPHTFMALSDPLINSRLLATLKSGWNPQDHLAVRQFRNIPKQESRFKVIHSLLDLHRLLRDEQNQAFDVSSLLAKPAPKQNLDDMPANKMATTPHQKGVLDGVLKDISESGWGLDWVERADERLTLGVLLGLEVDDKKWAVGILRRIQRQTIGSMRLGVGKLSDKPVAVTLGLSDGDVANLVGAEWLLNNEIMAILLPQKQDGMNVAQLILPSSAYQISREFRLRINDKICQVALGALIESGVEWQVCYLRILSAPKMA